MLDTCARRHVQPLIDTAAKLFINNNLSANKITIIALFIGLLVPITFYFNFPLLAVGILWISGFIDAVDGTIARLTNTSSSLGTLMDITFDRIVEIAIILVLAIKFPDSRLYLILLSVSIILTMTVFLTVGALSDKESEKTFYYQSGLMERSEGFIMFSLMLLFTSHLNFLTILFSILILFTAAQRFIQACYILK